MIDRDTRLRLLTGLSLGDLLMALAFVLLLVNLMPGPNEDRLTLRGPVPGEPGVRVAALGGAEAVQRSAYGGYLAELERRAELRRAQEPRQP